MLRTRQCHYCVLEIVLYLFYIEYDLFYKEYDNLMFFCFVFFKHFDAGKINQNSEQYWNSHFKVSTFSHCSSGSWEGCVGAFIFFFLHYWKCSCNVINVTVNPNIFFKCLCLLHLKNLPYANNISKLGGRCQTVL